LPKSHINKVQVQTNYSFFELFNDEAEDAVEQLRGQEFEGRPVRVDSVGNDEGKRLRRDKSKIERNGHFISRGKYKYAD
jgi:RNA recognition motif-containing protein